MSGEAIHFNVDAVEAFCRQLVARREALSERMRDERVLYDDVFNGWRDHRAQGIQARLAELARTVDGVGSDMDDLLTALRQQIRAAQEYLDGSEVW